MSTNKMKMFFALYTKDMRESIPEITVVAAVAVILNGIFYLRVIRPEAAGDPNTQLALIIPVLMVMGLAVFLPLFSSFKLLSREWNNNTVYFIMALPVSGAMILGSKLLALLTQYVVGTLIAGITGLILVWNVIPELMNLISGQPHGFSVVLLLYSLSAVFLVYLISISFFSQIIGRLSSRFSGLITGGVFVLTLYIVGKINDFTSNLNIRLFSDWDTTPIGSLLTANLMVLVTAAVIFTLAVVVYNRKVEL